MLVYLLCKVLVVFGLVGRVLILVLVFYWVSFSNLVVLRLSEVIRLCSEWNCC